MPKKTIYICECSGTELELCDFSEDITEILMYDNDNNVSLSVQLTKNDLIDLIADLQNLL